MVSQNSPTSGDADDRFLEGKLLIAMPGMSDPRFEKTVIFMCAHSADGGMGLIVNKPVVGLGFREMMEKLELGITENTPDLPVLYGGPVQTGRGFVLHSNDYESPDSTMTVGGDISLTATLDILRAIADGHGPKEAMFALGYAGWGPGQIESEIHANGWIHCDPDPAILFDPEMQTKWNRALGKLGINVASLSAHAGRA